MKKIILLMALLLLIGCGPPITDSEIAMSTLVSGRDYVGITGLFLSFYASRSINEQISIDWKQYYDSDKSTYTIFSNMLENSYRGINTISFTPSGLIAAKEYFYWAEIIIKDQTFISNIIQK